MQCAVQDSTLQYLCTTTLHYGAQTVTQRTVGFCDNGEEGEVEVKQGEVGQGEGEKWLVDGKGEGEEEEEGRRGRGKKREEEGRRGSGETKGSRMDDLRWNSEIEILKTVVYVCDGAVVALTLMNKEPTARYRLQHISCSSPCWSCRTNL